MLTRSEACKRTIARRKPFNRGGIDLNPRSAAILVYVLHCQTQQLK